MVAQPGHFLAECQQEGGILFRFLVRLRDGPVGCRLGVAGGLRILLRCLGINKRLRGNGLSLQCRFQPDIVFGNDFFDRG